MTFKQYLKHLRHWFYTLKFPIWWSYGEGEDDHFWIGSLPRKGETTEQFTCLICNAEREDELEDPAKGFYQDNALAYLKEAREEFNKPYLSAFSNEFALVVGKLDLALHELDGGNIDEVQCGS